MDIVEGSDKVLNAVLRQGSFILEALGISGILTQVLFAKECLCVVGLETEDIPWMAGQVVTYRMLSHSATKQAEKQ